MGINEHSNLKSSIEDALRLHLPRAASPLAYRLNQALEYAIFPGGKRLRPILCVLSAAAAAGSSNMENAMSAACGVEFLHASSLIFDDLPCMDDARMRRGNPVIHATFGEDFALLTGIALLNQVYALFAPWPMLVAEAARCVGVDGMVGGQAIDLSGTGHFSPEELAERNAKTSALIRLSMTAGAMACGALPKSVEALAQAGLRIGQAYQIFDDLLDLMKTGKTPGQDILHQRPTHANEELVIARGRACKLLAEAGSGIQAEMGDTEEVSDLLRFINCIFTSAQSQLA